MAQRRSANQRYHDRVAAKYEQVYSDEYWLWHDALTWDYLKTHLPRDINAPVVDLGCGTGKWGRKLLKSGYRVTFVDLSAKMLDVARQEVAEAGSDTKADFVQAELADLHGLPDSTYALATAMGEPICCTADPAVALRQIASKLANGGVLVATFDNRIACLDHYLAKGDPAQVEAFLRNGRTHWLTRDADERFEIHTFEPAKLERLLTACGLEPLEMIGKTVLPMRQHRELLEEPRARRRWLEIEKSLSRDPANLARCAHLQVAARKP